MSKVLVILAATAVENFAPGTVLNGYTVSLDGAEPVVMELNVPVLKADGTPSVNANGSPIINLAQHLFLDVTPGEHTAVVQLVDINGNTMGSPASGTISVPTPAPNVIGAVPQTLTLTVQ